MPLMTLGKGCEIANYPPKSLNDERLIHRKELGLPDMISSADGGPRVTLDLDDAAVLCGYADLRRAGYPVKLAGTVMSRVRTAMQGTPTASQFLNVTLENGFNFTVDATGVDLSSGFNSGGYISHALVIDVRNLRERVLRAIEANEPEIEAADAVAA